MKHSLFSVSYAGLWGQDRLDLVDFIRKAGQLGYTGVMLMGKRPHWTPQDCTSSERIATIQKALADAKTECTVIGAYTDFAGGGAAEVPWLDMQIGSVESLCWLAKKLNAGIVRVFTAYEAPGASYHSLWDRVVTALRECCDRAAAYGVTIAVQNHHDLAVHSDVMLELLCEVDRPNCKAAFDAWSPTLRGENVYHAARKLAPYTVCTTNADYIRLPRFVYQPSVVNYTAHPDAVKAVPFGAGCVDYPAFFRGLREGGFDGVATFEMCSPLRGGGSLENLDRCAAQYLKWMADNGYA
ncbi:MAG: sugar phosphate isomerase/epimerase [Gemmataceae bacterium]|nr:sugar phosphate isomerase/epimerase [Gemmataceae bacterium]MCI0737727.1 sugar phosphate isomerase/epimerase [Gemmataceae bacterium]